ncbi:MAG TPA: hypothetical protein PKN75_12670 [Bacteroidia bacterium]|nr:hypothetical protein [Bacteroidia bacterium]
MKNKKAVFILLPAVLVLWGIVFYRIYNAVNPTENVYVISKSVDAPNQTSLITTDTFQLINNYPDPFMKTVLVSRSKINRSSKVSNVRSKAAVNSNIVFPTIIYNGIIKNNNSKKVFAMLNVNGKDYLLQQGNNVENLKLIKINPDSVLMALGSFSKYIKREK